MDAPYEPPGEMDATEQAFFDAGWMTPLEATTLRDRVAGLEREADRLRGYWQPMASAPKDGDYFLIERDVPSINSMSIAFWHIGQNVPAFVHADSLGRAVDLNIYTIWRPLPRPALTPAQRKQIEACLAKEASE